METRGNTWKHVETHGNTVQCGTIVFQWAVPQTPSRSNERLLHLEFERSPTTSRAGEKAFGS